MKFLFEGLFILLGATCAFGMQNDAQRDVFRLYAQGYNFSVTHDKDLTTYNAHTDSALMNLVVGNPQESSYKKVADEFKQDFHLWSVPEDDEVSRKKLESTGRYNYLADISYMECDAIIPVEKELEVSKEKLQLSDLEIVRVNKENFADFVQNQAEVFFSFPYESIKKFYTSINIVNAINSHAFVAYHQNKIVGSVMMHCGSPDIMGVYNLGVVSELRCKGIGRLLLLTAYDKILRPNTLKKIVGVTNLPEFFEQFKAQESLRAVIYLGRSQEKNSMSSHDDQQQ